MQPDRELLQYTFNLLQIFPRQVLFLDTRSVPQFTESHISGSFNIPLDIDTAAISSVFLENLFRNSAVGKLYAMRKRLCIIVSGDLSTQATARAIYEVLISEKCKETHLLAPFGEEFLRLYSFLCVGSTLPPLSLSPVGYPNEIIADKLFLGSQLHAQSLEVVRHLGITHIVNATKSIENRFQDTIEYCRVVVEDSESEMICYHFSKAFRFMDVAMMDVPDGPQNRILVHCAQGVSRSATLVIMYLMRRNDLTFEQALGYVRKHRIIVDPNNGFQEQLKEFENSRYSFKRSKTIFTRGRSIPERTSSSLFPEDLHHS